MLTVEASRAFIDNLHRSHALVDKHGNETKYEDLWFRWTTLKLPAASSIINHNNEGSGNEKTYW
jgi:hypothetical protein